MENNQVALSQSEVDKLLGIQRDSKPSEPVAKKQYKVKNFLSEAQLNEVRDMCKLVYKYFKLSLRKKFGEPKIRKLTITSLEQQNIDEFFDTLTDNDFVYEAKFGKAKAYIKFDSFLFGALSGMTIDTKHKINYFQSEVLKDFVAQFLLEGFARQLKKNCKTELKSIYNENKESFKTGKTGLCVAINWNENLRSFGIEKIFLTKEVIGKFRTVSK